jgi:hypothetical protein
MIKLNNDREIARLKLNNERDVAVANSSDARLQLAESIKTMTDAQLLAYRGRDSVSLE